MHFFSKHFWTINLSQNTVCSLMHKHLPHQTSHVIATPDLAQNGLRSLSFLATQKQIHPK